MRIEMLKINIKVVCSLLQNVTFQVAYSVRAVGRDCKRCRLLKLCKLWEKKRNKRKEGGAE